MSAIIQHLEWDSQFFGKRVGIVHVDETLDSPSSLLSNDFDIVYVFSSVDQGERWSKHFIEERKTLHTLSKPFSEEHTNIRPVTIENRDELIPLCLIAGHDSRFKKDERLSSFFTALYTQWADRCLNEMTYGYFANDALVGFTSFRGNRCDLVGVHPKYRGKGIARKLHNYSVNQLFMQGIPDIMVTTQLSNKIALKFYESRGYLPFSHEFIYHLHSGY